MGDSSGHANERAESLRRMFPQRPQSAPPAREQVEPPVELPVPGPRRRWPIAVGVIALLGVAGAAGAFSLRKPGEAGTAPVAIGQSFPAVTPPSFDESPAGPAPSVLPSLSRSPSQSVVPSGPSSGHLPQRSSKSPSPTAAPTTATAKQNGPITSFSACSANGSVTFTATFADGFDYHHVFIDADGDTSTGYHIYEVAGGFGADYLLENEYFYKSTGRGWDWREMDGVSPLQSRSGGVFQWRLRSSYGGVRALFNGSDGSDTEAFTAVTAVRSC